MTHLVLQQLTPEGFASYGQVLRRPRNKSREDFVAGVENLRPATARANLALIDASPVHFPFEIRRLERHAFSNQAFLPLNVSEFMVIVCHDNGHGRPDVSTLRGFRAEGHTGINYKPGIWHHGMTTIGRPGTFVVLTHEDGSTGDCHFADVEPIAVGLS